MRSERAETFAFLGRVMAIVSILAFSAVVAVLVVMQRTSFLDRWMPPPFTLFTGVSLLGAVSAMLYAISEYTLVQAKSKPA